MIITHNHFDSLILKAHPQKKFRLKQILFITLLGAIGACTYPLTETFTDTANVLCLQNSTALSSNRSMLLQKSAWLSDISLATQSATDNHMVNKIIKYYCH